MTDLAVLEIYARRMDMGQVQLADLVATLNEEQAFVRAALQRGRDGWALRTCEAIVGSPPSSWRVDQWKYQSHAFVATVAPATAILDAFRPNQTGQLVIGEFRVSVPPVYDALTWRHLPSRAVHDPAPLPWPTIDYEVVRSETQEGGGPSNFLVGEGYPSFTDADAALQAFFYGDFSTIGGARRESRVALVRHVQREAWIERVTVGVAHVEVVLRGDAVAGVQVEVNGTSLRTHKTTGSRGRVRLPTPEGLPDDALLFVTRGNRWLDYRALGHQLSAATRRVDPAVEIMTSDDPDGRVGALVAHGEGPRLEFKRDLPTGTDESRRKVLKTVAAFANADGGAILFGIDPDEVTVVGIPVADEQAERDRLGEIIHRSLRPTPDFEARWASAAGKRVLLLEVAHGLVRPYGIQLHGDGLTEYYVRRGASTFPATQQEVREIAVQSAAGVRAPGQVGHQGGEQASGRLRRCP